MSKKFVFGAAVAAFVPVQSASAAVAPLTISGFNQDVVVDNVATLNTNVQGFVTATMDDGTAKTGGTWYQTGLVAASPTTGLPTGTTQSSATGNGTFALASASGPNALLLNNATPTGTLTLTSPVPLNQVAFYDATGNGNGTINYLIHFVGGATEGGSFTSGDWFNNSPTALNANGRINNTVNGTTDNVNAGNPRIYEHLFGVANTSAAVQSIDFTRAAANGNTSILAVSGAQVPEPGSIAALGVAATASLIRRRRTR
jgi:hypothetical protein